jgi:protein required for attachment to host cells
MLLPANAHVAIADGTHFVLMRNTGNGQDVALTAVSQPEVSDSNKSAGVNHHDGGDARGEDIAEFAHAAGVAAFLNSAVLKGTISKLVVIADPSTLGEMRQHYHDKLKDALVGEINKTLTGHSAGDIAKSIAAA